MIHYTSDPHIFHKNILLYSNRPFESLDQMNKVIVGNINKQVMPEDELWMLGDVLMGTPYKKYREVMQGILYEIHCKNVHICWGNHDKFFVGDLFKSAQLKARFDVGNKLMILDHYCNLVWENSHKGTSIHLYGHSHASLEPFMDKLFPERMSLDVGVDNAYKLLGEYRPFSHDDILNHLNGRKGHTVDHHKVETIKSIAE